MAFINKTKVLQFFVPGIPQVYYVGLLAGENDQEAAAQSGEGRDINRHNYTMEEIEQAATTEVVQRLVKLIRFRNQHPAFNGEFHIIKDKGNKIHLRWENGDAFCELRVDLSEYAAEITYSDADLETKMYKV